MADLEELAGDLRERGIALCVDLVLNHTAREHEWARKAAAGEPAYREMYLIYPDRTQPDAYERTLPEVFPGTAPGSFTEVPALGWVWTTFHDYQWDLNYANPAVFRAMLGTMFALANHGVDVLRLDAAPFLWKRMGTDCQNQPEAHLLLQAFRALARLAAPGLVLEAEAIVGPDMLVQYLGGHDRYRPECDWPTTTSSWSCSGRRWRPATCASPSTRSPAPARTGADRLGFLPALPRRHRLGRVRRRCRVRLARRSRAPAVPQRLLRRPLPGSFARGALFQENPVTGDARVSGTAASLCGIESALAGGDPEELTLAIRRLESMYAVVFSFGGIPLIYMGDELGVCNDPRWQEDPAHAGDNRWMHELQRHRPGGRRRGHRPGGTAPAPLCALDQR